MAKVFRGFKVLDHNQNQPAEEKHTNPKRIRYFSNIWTRSEADPSTVRPDPDTGRASARQNKAETNSDSGITHPNRGRYDEVFITTG